MEIKFQQVSPAKHYTQIIASTDEDRPESWYGQGRMGFVWV
jgi:hypothetical protein